MEEFSLKSLSCVGVIAMDSPDEGLYETWALSE